MILLLQTADDVRDTNHRARVSIYRPVETMTRRNRVLLLGINYNRFYKIIVLAFCCDAYTHTGQRKRKQKPTVISTAAAAYLYDGVPRVLQALGTIITTICVARNVHICAGVAYNVQLLRYCGKHVLEFFFFSQTSTREER